MKKYFFTALSLALFTIGFTASDYNQLFPDDPQSPGTTTPSDPEAPVEPDPASDVQAVAINTDAASPEVLSVTTKSGEVLTYYGEKNTDGTAESMTSMEYTSADGVSSIIDMNEDGTVSSITSNDGASITFEWISESTAVINAHSQEDNIVVSTIYDFANPAEVPAAKMRSDVASSRNGEFAMQVIPSIDFAGSELNNMLTRAYDSSLYPESQQINLEINQCGSSYNAKNYLLLKDAATGATVGKLMNSNHAYKGHYVYQLPKSSYPSVATHIEICTKIDIFLNISGRILGGASLNANALIVALTNAATVTGIGYLPNSISKAIYSFASATELSMSIVKYNGGIAAMMSWSTSTWIYKEFIISDLDIIPVAYTQSMTVVGDAYRITPGDAAVTISLDMDEDPVIDSFTLDPSHPGAGVSYNATAEYHCIPNGSTITLSIIGTDGYQNSRTDYISGSGSAVLYVPGAATGVYDLCTALIEMPSGESITMQASLVFGY